MSPTTVNTDDLGEAIVTFESTGRPARKVPVELWGGLMVDEVLTLVSIASTTTNPKGKYSFEGLDFGDYEVYAVSSDGTEEVWSGTFTISSETPKEVDLKLVLIPNS
ncbi:MAG: carboxypeptidase regulatory-like domain-containing protein [Planctomycetales bacterium]